MKEAILIAGGILIAILVIIVTLYAKLLLVIKKQTEEALNAVKGEKILLSEKSANFFGQKSQGHTQIRGNGILILTDRMLYFKMWMPDKTIQIPLEWINKIEKVNGFLGKTKFRPLFKITFYNKYGLEDEVAWLVQDPDKWIFRIDKLLKSI